MFRSKVMLVFMVLLIFYLFEQCLLLGVARQYDDVSMLLATQFNLFLFPRLSFSPNRAIGQGRPRRRWDEMDEQGMTTATTGRTMERLCRVRDGRTEDGQRTTTATTDHDGLQAIVLIGLALIELLRPRFLRLMASIHVSSTIYGAGCTQLHIGFVYVGGGAL